jgi:hypothetical protein
MYTENIHNHTSVENGAMKEKRLGGSLVARLYRMEMPATPSKSLLVYMAVQE